MVATSHSSTAPHHPLHLPHSPPHPRVPDPWPVQRHGLVMNGPHQDKGNFVPDLAVLTAREEELVGQVEEDNILQWREEVSSSTQQRWEQTVVK